MDTLFDLRPTHNSHRWSLPVVPEICVGAPPDAFMFGGVGLASAITALERTTGRPVVWATAQYLSFARPPSMLDLDVRTLAEGRFSTQARVVSHVEDREILTVNAALGERPNADDRQWTKAPAVPRPEDCEPAPRWDPTRPGLQARLEVRLAPAATAAEGRRMIWVRPRERFPIDSGMLAVIADLAPWGISVVFNDMAALNSLDNTLRVRRIVPTEWVLCDIAAQGLHSGFAHATMTLFAQDGEMMGAASQSMVVRRRKPAAGEASAAPE